MNILRNLRLPLFIIGMILFFISERYLTTPKTRLTLTGVALFLCAVGWGMSVVLRRNAIRGALDREGQVWKYLSYWQGGILLSLIAYLIYRKVLGETGVPETALQKGLLATWCVLLFVSLASGIGLEVSWSRSGKGSFAEPRRVMAMGQAWLMVGTLFCSLVAFNYYAAKKDVSYDVSYFKVTEPGESTRNTIKTLTQPVDISIFFPRNNEVRPLVSEYFEKLKQYSNFVQINYYDKDLNPAKAEELKVSKNGQVVLKYGDRTERMAIGDNLRSARSPLKKLDGMVVKSLTAMTSPLRTAYFTRGHGELTWDDSAKDPFRAITGLEMALKSQSYTLRIFGGQEGSMTKVPDDASLMVIAGPTSAFLAEEVHVIRDFVEAGGKLLVLLDAGIGIDTKDVFMTSSSRDPLLQYLDELGLVFHRERVANEKKFVAVTRTEVDKWFIYSNAFGSHPSVSNLARNDDRVQIIMAQSGYFDLGTKNEKWKTYETIKSFSDSFNDVNRNFTFDSDKERKGTFVLGAAAEMTTKPEKAKDTARVLAYGASSAFTDAVLRNPGNQLLIMDGLKWLLGEMEKGGSVETEEDMKIMHSHEKDVSIFYGAIFSVPLLVTGFGFVATGLMKRRRRS